MFFQTLQSMIQRLPRVEQDQNDYPDNTNSLFPFFARMPFALMAQKQRQEDRWPLSTIQGSSYRILAPGTTAISPWNPRTCCLRPVSYLKRSWNTGDSMLIFDWTHKALWLPSEGDGGPVPSFHGTPFWLQRQLPTVVTQTQVFAKTFLKMNLPLDGK